MAAEKPDEKINIPTLTEVVRILTDYQPPQRSVCPCCGYVNRCGRTRPMYR